MSLLWVFRVSFIFAGEDLGPLTHRWSFWRVSQKWQPRVQLQNCFEEDWFSSFAWSVAGAFFSFACYLSIIYTPFTIERSISFISLPFMILQIFMSCVLSMACRWGVISG
jgi:hypothetical protein